VAGAAAESFAALGAGGMVICACPPLDPVVVEAPGPFYGPGLNERLLPAVVDAVEEPASESEPGTTAE